MIEICVKGVQLYLETAPSLFSPGGIDKGTAAMLSLVDLDIDGKLLDLGCGYGVVGILAAKLLGSENVVMCDISPLAVEISRCNAELNGVPDINIVESDGFNSVDESGFSLILSNPPYHTDFSVAKRFIEIGFKRLIPGGRMYMVTKRREWYKNKFISVFGGVIITEIDGYFVFMAEKRVLKHRS